MWHIYNAPYRHEVLSSSQDCTYYVFLFYTFCKLIYLLAPLTTFRIYRTKAQVVTRLFIGKRYFYFCITSTIYFFLHTCRHCIIPSLRAPLPQPSLQPPPPPPHPDSTLCCKNATYLCANKIKSLYSQSLYKFIHNLRSRPKILRE